MKKKLLTASLFIALSNLSFGQINLEQSYSTYSPSLSEPSTFKKSDNSLFYYTFNKLTNQFSIYDENHTLKKQFIAPLISGDNLGQINLITDHLINSDDATEFVCSIWATGKENKVVIFNDEGQLLHSFNNRYGIHLVKTANNNYKLIFPYNFDATPEIPYSHTKYDVYSLTGTLSTSQEEVINQLRHTPYPNPATNTLTIPVGNNTNEYVDIEIFDQAGRRITNEKIKIQDGEINLNISSLSAGTYFYKIDGNSKKFIKN